MPTIFEHVDVSCENWPDRSVIGDHEYRGYSIEGNMIVGGWDYCHKDYDEGDPRHGHELTRDNVYRAIDEREDE